MAIVLIDGADPADPERALGRIERVVAGPAAGHAPPVVRLPAWCVLKAGSGQRVRVPPG